MATNDQIKSAYDTTMSQGFNWDDWMAGASKYGVTQDQMSAAGIYSPITPQEAPNTPGDVGVAPTPSSTTPALNWLSQVQAADQGTYNKNNLTPTLYDGRYYVPEYSGGGGGGEGGFDNPGTLGGYQSYAQEDAGKPTGTGQYYDTAGNYSHDYTWEDDNLNEMLFLAAAGGLAFLPGGLASTLSGSGATAAGAGTAASSTPGVGTTFGVVDSTVGTGGGSLYGLGSGTSGLGLQAGVGDGLTLASTTGGPGIIASAGPGLDLAAAAGGSLGGGLGLNAVTAGNALVSGAGLGTGLANGTGSLLGPEGLSGTYTMADGTIIPGTVPGTTLPVTPTAPPVTPTTPTGPTVPKVVPPIGGGTGGLGLDDLIKLIGGGIDADRQGDASDKLLDWLKSRTAITDNLYQPGTPEYNQLWDEMSRKDAAAGRNSQYGPRSVDLAARIAQIKASENTKMTTGIGQWMKGAYDQDASKYTGLLSALNSMGGSGSSGSLIDMIGKLFGNGGTTLNLTDTVDEDSFQPEDGDYGQ